MLKVALIGATGAVGQQFVLALDRHPWFQLTDMASSERSAGKTFIDAIRDPKSGILRWHSKETIPEYVSEMILNKVEDLNPKKFDVVFTALESEDAQMIEPRFGRSVPVISTAAAFRYEDDVPILIPGINDEHSDLLNFRARREVGRGL
jgi:aspartate-semialdehyde dehydrogenase